MNIFFHGHPLFETLVHTCSLLRTYTNVLTSSVDASFNFPKCQNFKQKLGCSTKTPLTFFWVELHIAVQGPPTFFMPPLSSSQGPIFWKRKHLYFQHTTTQQKVIFLLENLGAAKESSAEFWSYLEQSL